MNFLIIQPPNVAPMPPAGTAIAPVCSKKRSYEEEVGSYKNQRYEAIGTDVKLFILATNIITVMFLIRTDPSLPLASA